MQIVSYSVGPAEFGATSEGSQSCRSGDTEVLLAIRPGGEVKMTILVYEIKWARSCQGGAKCVCIRSPAAGWQPDPSCRTIYVRGERSLRSISTHESLAEAQACFRRMTALGYDGIDLRENVDWSDGALAIASAPWVVRNQVFP